MTLAEYDIANRALRMLEVRRIDLRGVAWESDFLRHHYQVQGRDYDRELTEQIDAALARRSGTVLTSARANIPVGPNRRT